MSLPDLLAPVRSAVEALLVLLHQALVAAGLDPAGGIGWLAAVALLVVVVRALLLPLAVRQHRSGLRMRAIAQATSAFVLDPSRFYFRKLAGTVRKSLASR